MCAALGDFPEEMRRRRNLYAEGFPEWVPAHVFEVSLSDLHSHSWRHNWHRRRSINLPDRRHLLELLLLDRMKKGWHLIDHNTTDRALATLAKLVTGGAKEKVTLKSTITLKWEDRLRQMHRELEKKGEEAER